MTVDIQTTDDGILVIQLPERLDSNTSQTVRDEVIPLIDEGTRCLLDMRTVKYLSSAGLRVLLVIYRTISDKDGRVILVGVSQRLQDVMSMTGFLSHFIFYDTIESGLSALST